MKTQTTAQKILPDFWKWANQMQFEYGSGVITTYCANGDKLTLLLPEFRFYVVKRNDNEIFRSDNIDDSLLEYIGQSPIASIARYYHNGIPVGGFNMEKAFDCYTNITDGQNQ